MFMLAPSFIVIDNWACVIDDIFLTQTDDRSSIFRMPFKSKLSLSKAIARDDKQITTIQQASSSSVSAPNREQDYATHLKNLSLVQKIHETLHSRNSASMPNISNGKGASPTYYCERSVDEEPQAGSESPIEVIVEESEALFATMRGKENHEKQEEIAMKRVKFEEINEIEEEQMFAVQRTTSFNDSTEVLESFSSSPSDSPQSPSSLPPTPMKRKSRENSFERPKPSLVNGDQVDGLVEPPLVKPRTKRLSHQTSDLSKLDEILPMIEIGNIEEIISGQSGEQNEPKEIEVEETASSQQDKKNPDQLVSEAVPEILLNGHDESLEDPPAILIIKQKVGVQMAIEVCPPFEVPPSQPIEVQVVPKSILKSSETSSTQKSISFQNRTNTIQYEKELSSSSSSESEDEDVWSRVDQHRNLLTRSHPDTPPPLPKTPPPPLDNEDGKHFSFA